MHSPDGMGALGATDSQEQEARPGSAELQVLREYQVLRDRLVSLERQAQPVYRELLDLPVFREPPVPVGSAGRRAHLVSAARQVHLAFQALRERLEYLELLVQQESRARQGRPASVGPQVPPASADSRSPASAAPEATTGSLAPTDRPVPPA